MLINVSTVVSDVRAPTGRRHRADVPATGRVPKHADTFAPKQLHRILDR
jgi:hypothetical protein